MQVQTFKPIAAAIPWRGQSGRGALVQYCDAVGNTDRSPEIVEESHQAAIQAYRFQYMAWKFPEWQLLCLRRQEPASTEDADQSANTTEAALWSGKLILDTVLFSLFFEGYMNRKNTSLSG